MTARQYYLVSVTWRSIRPRRLVFSQKQVPVRGGYSAVFASPGTNFEEGWRVRGTILLSGRNIVPVHGTCKRKKERSGPYSHPVLVKVAFRSPAKIVTSLLIILTVLGLAFIL